MMYRPPMYRPLPYNDTSKIVEVCEQWPFSSDSVLNDDVKFLFVVFLKEKEKKKKTNALVVWISPNLISVLAKPVDDFKVN